MDTIEHARRYEKGYGMVTGTLFSAESPKTAKSFIEAVYENASRFGFGVRDVFELKRMYQGQGVDVADTFDAFSILICNFVRSYQSIRHNPRRAAVLLQPKQIVVHENGNGITVDYLPFSKSFVKEALPADPAFADSLSKSYQKVVSLITSCL